MFLQKSPTSRWSTRVHFFRGMRGGGQIGVDFNHSDSHACFLEWFVISKNHFLFTIINSAKFEWFLNMIRKWFVYPCLAHARYLLCLSMPGTCEVWVRHWHCVLMIGESVDDMPRHVWWTTEWYYRLNGSANKVTAPCFLVIPYLWWPIIQWINCTKQYVRAATNHR